MPESKLRRIAALAALVVAVFLLALAGGGNAFAAATKAPKGAKAATMKAAKVSTHVRMDAIDPPPDPGGDGLGWVEPPGDSHFGW